MTQTTKLLVSDNIMHPQTESSPVNTISVYANLHVVCVRIYCI